MVVGSRDDDDDDDAFADNTAADDEPSNLQSLFKCDAMFVGSSGGEPLDN